MVKLPTFPSDADDCMQALGFGAWGLGRSRAPSIEIRPTLVSKVCK